MKTTFRLLIIILVIAVSPRLYAIRDTNQNGVSDLWEYRYNEGRLYLAFDLAADPDADGWTNAQEAAARTDPTSGTGPTGPTGYVSPEVTNTSGVVTITWPTMNG